MERCVSHQLFLFWGDFAVGLGEGLPRMEKYTMGDRRRWTPRFIGDCVVAAISQSREA